ncbi:MAG TPA: GNAT family N-acetyltransferase [Ideonella sp.]|uniref:GNAT family N-acetyltransferase n=1 Tax=Ideonella sp. TaxID=1929293 RepID=UPI002BF35EA7|nr:GNAT family N-acetyltransferase [Ideonella sp.]HSI46752.1 GNAT family N-acetyltransferase [Ideonella sp.]
MSAAEDTRIEGWPAELSDGALGQLAALLQASVAAGASIGWVDTPSEATALAFWRNCSEAAARGERSGWWALQQGRVVGSVQVVWQQPENGAHRVDLVKLMVHPEARRAGIASRLMDAAEAEVARRGRRLIVLDTWRASPAEGLYWQRGYQRSGFIPDYALTTAGGAGATRVMFKRLGTGGLQVRPGTPDAPEAQALLDALSAELLQNYGSDGRSGLANWSPQGSTFALARTGNGEPIGCGAFRPLALPATDGEGATPRCAEIKRMYARERGQGIGQAVLAWLTHEAWTRGYRELRLATRRANTRARRFYAAQGFTECAPWGRYVGRAESVCMGLALDD